MFSKLLENFLFSSNLDLSFAHFQFGRVKNFVVWERVKGPLNLGLSSEKFLSHNNPCFQCNIAITIFFVLHTCEIIFHDIKGQSTVRVYSYTKILKHD